MIYYAHTYIYIYNILNRYIYTHKYMPARYVYDIYFGFCSTKSSISFLAMVLFLCKLKPHFCWFCNSLPLCHGVAIPWRVSPSKWTPCNTLHPNNINSIGLKEERPRDNQKHTKNTISWNFSVVSAKITTTYHNSLSALTSYWWSTSAKAVTWRSSLGWCCERMETLHLLLAAAVIASSATNVFPRRPTEEP